MSSPTLITIVPCYNEEHRLSIQSFLRELSSYPEAHFVFVDDGSTDRTLLKLEQELKSSGSSRASLLALERNFGKAEAVRQGMLMALEKFPSAAYFGFLDADAATQPPEYLEMFDTMRAKDSLEAVFASRVRLLGRKIDRRPLRHWISRIFATWTSWLLEIPIYDTQCGAKIFKRKLLEKTLTEAFITRWLFDIEWILRILIEYKKDGLRYFEIEDKIHEIPLQRWHDVSGSKLKLSDFIRGPLELFRIWWWKKKNTGRFFGSFQ